MSCLSALYMLQNVLIVKLAKLYTVNLYVFLTALYMLRTPVWVQNTKVMPQYPAIYLFSWEREGIFMSQNLT